MPYLILIIVLMGGVGGWYYNDSQERIATLQENNAKLEVAVETSEASLKTMQEDAAKMAELNKQLSADLQKAEAYGDDLRSKLSRHNLTALALKKPGQLEGKMNGATAKLWRELEKDTGGTGDADLPSWLLPDPVQQQGTGSESGNEAGKDSNTNSSSTETSTAN